jgi:hypothetical protein
VIAVKETWHFVWELVTAPEQASTRRSQRRRDTASADARQPTPPREVERRRVPTCDAA